MERPGSKKRTAIVCSGGGMRGAYTAGGLVALVEKHNFTSPDLIIGGSCSAGSILYFVSGQIDFIRLVWTSLLSTKQFISLFRLNKIMDVDYLVDCIFRQKAPLDINSLRSSTIDYRIAVTDFDTGALRYVNCQDNLDPYETLRASKASPITYNRAVRLGEGRYVDLYNRSVLHESIHLAERCGAQTIILFDNAGDITFLSKIFLRAYALFTPKQLASKIRRQLSSDYTLLAPSSARIIQLKPSRPIQVGLLTRDRQKLREAFDCGYHDTVTHPELVELFP